MKRTFLALLALCLLPACTGGIPAMGFETDLTAKAIKAMPAPLDLDEAIAGGPLYVFDADNPDPTLRAFRKLKQARVSEMIGMMEEEEDVLGEALEAMPAYRAAILSFFGELSAALDPADPDGAALKALALDTIDRETVAMIRTTADLANLEALAEAIEEMEEEEADKLLDSPALPALQFTRWLALGNLVEALRQEFASSQLRAGMIVGFIRDNDKKFNRKAVKIAKRWGKRIGKGVEEVDEPFREALAIHRDIMACFESLKAADYAFIMAWLDFSERQLPEISKKADGIKTGPAVDEADKELARTMARFLTAFTDGIRPGMKAAEPPPFFRMTGEPVASGFIPPFLGVAHAGASEMLGRAAGALTAGAKGLGSTLYGMAEAGAKAPFFAIEMARQGASTVASSIIHGANKGAGYVIDWGTNFAYGTAYQDRKEEYAKTWAKSEVAWQRGMQGAETMHTTYDYLDSVEKGVSAAAQETVRGGFNMAGYMADKMTGGLVQNVWGADYAAPVAGKLGELGAGMFTGFGKGVINLTLPDATNENLLEGWIDVIFSGIGGTKALVKGSQVLKGAGALKQEMAEKLTSAATRLELKLENAALKGTSDDLLRAAQGRIMSGQEIAILCDNTRKIMANEVREQTLKNAEKSIGRILSELAGKSKDKIVKNLEEVPGEVSKFVSESVEGGLKAIPTAVAGETKGAFAENLANGYADGLVKEGLKYILLPDKDAAAIKEMLTQQARAANLDPDDPKNKEALEKIEALLVEQQQKLKKDLADAEQKAIEQAEKVLAEKALADQMGDIRKVEVEATGSFSGDYKGSVSLTLTPAGGPVSGTVTTSNGTASVSGSISPDGKLEARVSGAMSYNWYGDGVRVTEKRQCNLSASMKGTVGSRRVSGTYTGSCAKEGDKGSWTASW